MEYLKVAFNEKRKVVIDGMETGWTNEILELEKGMHLVTLSPYSDFKPLDQVIVLINTNPDSPRELHFEKA